MDKLLPHCVGKCSFSFPLTSEWARSQPDGLGFWWPHACASEGDESPVLICVCRTSVQLSVQASVFNVYYTVQEGQTVSSDIFLHELDIIVHSIYMFCEGFNFPWSDFDPGVIHISKKWG